MVRSFIQLMLSAVVIAGAAVADESPDGTWKWRREMGDQTINSVLRLESEDGKVTGTYKNESVDTEIENGKFSGGKLTFDVNVDFNGSPIQLKFHGEPSEDSIKGAVSIFANDQQQGDDLTWDAQRHVGNEEVLGSWKMDFTSPDGIQHKPTVVIESENGKLVGKMVSPEGQLDLDSLEVKEGEFSFRYESAYQGGNVKVKQTWRPRGNQVTGTLHYDFDGNTGEFEIAAERKQLPGKLRSLLGEWTFVMTGDDGIRREPVLTLREDDGELAASLVDGDKSFDLRNVNFADDTLTFDFSNQHDGFAVEISWEASLVDQDNMKGKIHYDAGGNTGEIDTSGKRKG